MSQCFKITAQLIKEKIILGSNHSLSELLNEINSMRNVTFSLIDFFSDSDEVFLNNIELKAFRFFDFIFKGLNNFVPQVLLINLMIAYNGINFDTLR